ncbi:MAG TPA: MFS transporter [Spirochaetota bacterium]|nr:MFS transporter [Spirochaetota bacterium]HNT12724.1 MFS transporter [Spirochaetota bacterium]HNV45751.1 MFS transporter [Spirochaetota bacterium]HOS38143.1 MFS transporter [Spirochaetota bacterium]HPI22246.1 MFS transporter [Spirochaetota bacterium]
MNRPRKLYLDANLQIVFWVTLMVVMGVSNITPAIPAMAKALSIADREIGLIISVFTLPGVFLTPVFGFLADRYGRKRVLVPSLVLFGIAGTMCFWCESFASLLALRFVQGIGAASLGAVNVTIISDLFSGRERTAALGYNASVLSIGTASYPAIGGALAMLGWNYPFLMTAAAIPVALAVLFLLNNPEPHARPEIRAYFAAVFRVVRARQVVGLFIASLAAFIFIYGAILTYFPILMAQSFGATALAIGLFLTAMSVANAITSSQLGRLARRWSERAFVIAGFSLYAVVCALIPFAASYPLMLVPVVIGGMANGIVMPSLQALLAGAAPPAQRAAFMSFNGMLLRAGQTGGPVLLALFYHFGGMRFTFLATAACMLVMLGVIAWLVRDERAAE